MSRLRVVRRALLLAASGPSALVRSAKALASSAPRGAVAAVPAVALGLMVWRHRRRSSGHSPFVREAIRRAEAGRNLAIYERETGLLAHWYVSLRGEEECERAARYTRPLTLLVAEASPDADPWTVQEQIAQWLRRQIRRADIAGYLGNGRYVVLMPEVPAAGARVVVTRLHQDIRGLDTGLSSYPSDGATFNQLYEAAARRLGKPLKKAA